MKYNVFGTDGRKYIAVCDSLNESVEIYDEYGECVDEALMQRGLLLGHYDDYHSSEIYNFAMMQ